MLDIHIYLNKDCLSSVYMMCNVMFDDCLQVSPSRVRLRRRSSAMIKVTGHVTFDTGRLNRVTTLCTWSVTTRTLRTAPSWLTSFLLPTTSSQKTWDQNLTDPKTVSQRFDCLTWRVDNSPQVKCYGPGLEPLGCIVNKPADFTIDTHGAGRGELKLYAQVTFKNEITLFRL